MKSILVLIVLFALVAVLAACSGDGDDGGFLAEDTIEEESGSQISEAEGLIQTDEGAVRHDAIDSDPAADPAEREVAYFEVAGKLIEDSLTEPNRDFSYELVWEEPIDGNARVRVTGFFQEGGEWVEKDADFGITRTPSGNWILENEVQFVKTADQRARERDEQKIVEYTAALAVFDAISVSVVSFEVVPAEAFERKYFTVQIDNQTNEDHEVGYMLQWTVTSEDSRCKDPEEKKSGREKIAASSAVSVEVEVPTNLFGVPRHCGNPWLENVRVAIASIDGDVREEVERRLAELQSQTSP